MKKLLLTYDGRINRAKFWLAAAYIIGISFVVGLLLTVLWQVIPGTVSDEGEFNVSGVAAIPYIVLIFGYIALCFWSGICVGIKRYHDRGKSGAWILIQLVPIIGGIWYFIEAGCLRGTVGDNAYGPDPLA